MSEGNQPLSSPSQSNLETPLAPEPLLEAPSIPNPKVIVTFGQGSEIFAPSDHGSMVSNTSIQFPNLITFIDPLYETYLFPSERPI